MGYKSKNDVLISVDHGHGEIKTHIMGGQNTDHATLCGVDGSLDMIVGRGGYESISQAEREECAESDGFALPKVVHKQVNCSHCIAIWEACRDIPPRFISDGDD